MNAEPCGLASEELRRDDHSSSLAITGEVKQPTRKLRTGHPRALPYLVLLRAGFCLPPTLRPARCALTAPFHPYPPPPSALRPRAWARPAHLGFAPLEASIIRSLPRRSSEARSAESEGGRYIFCATFLQVTLTGRYPAHCPAEFGLSSLHLHPPERPCGLSRGLLVNDGRLGSLRWFHSNAAARA
jgi:hypothetical protein